MGERLRPRTADTWRDVPWGSYDVPTLWKMIEREYDDCARIQVSAWRQTYEVLDEFRKTLEALADALAGYWPPVENSPAILYQSTLVDLIASVASTSHDSYANALALDSISDTLMGARAQVGALNECWPSDPSPFTQAQMLAAHQQAVSVMSEADKASYDYGTALSLPDVYYSDIETGTRLEPEYQGTIGSRGGGQGSLRAGAGGDSVGPASGLAGPPVLAGGPPPVVLPPQSPPSGPIQPGPVQSVPQPSRPRVPIVPGVRPVGGVFGPSDGSDARRLAQPVEGAESRRPGGASVDEAGRAGSGERQARSLGQGVVGAGGALRQGTSRRRQTGEPYTEWYVERGVPSVLEPEREAEPEDHDPGRGVWGIDR